MNEPDKSPALDSKSQRKRDMSALQKLGEKLATLPEAQLRKCELPATLSSALAEFRRLPNKHGARRRQLQYIGKLMRSLDQETLQGITAATSEDPLSERRRFMALEAQRTRLLAGDAQALKALLGQHPEVDREQLETLLATARREADEGRSPPLASRRLFQLLRRLQDL